MKQIRKQRLYMVLFIVLGSSVAIGLTLYALSENINLFYTPSDIAAGKAPNATRIRGGGIVVAGSVERDPNSLMVKFAVTDSAAQVTMVYSGILPDLFAEGEGIVATGKLDEQGIFQASEVLAKHDENYSPPEVVDAIKKAQKSKMLSNQHREAL